MASGWHGMGVAWHGMPWAHLFQSEARQILLSLPLHQPVVPDALIVVRLFEQDQVERRICRILTAVRQFRVVTGLHTFTRDLHARVFLDAFLGILKSLNNAHSRVRRQGREGEGGEGGGGGGEAGGESRGRRGRGSGGRRQEAR